MFSSCWVFLAKTLKEPRFLTLFIQKSSQHLGFLRFLNGSLKVGPFTKLPFKKPMFSWIFKLFIFFWFCTIFLRITIPIIPNSPICRYKKLTSNRCPTEPFFCPNTYFRTLVEVCSPTIFLIFLAPEPKPIITRINFQRVSYIGAFFCVPKTVFQDTC